MDTLRRKFPALTSKPCVVAAPSTFVSDESHLEAVIKNQCQQLNITLKYLRSVWQKKNCSEGIFFNSYNSILDQVENLNSDLQKKSFDKTPAVDLASRDLHNHLSHLIKFCDSVTLNFDVNLSWTDEAFETLIQSVEWSIQNLMDSMHEIVDHDPNMTSEIPLAPDPCTGAKLTKTTSETTISITDTLRTDSMTSSNDFCEENKQSDTCPSATMTESNSEITRSVIDSSLTDTVTIGSSFDESQEASNNNSLESNVSELEDFPIIRKHDASITQESRQKKLSNRMSTPCDIQTYIQKMLNVEPIEKDKIALLVPTVEPCSNVKAPSTTILAEINESEYLIWEHNNDKRKIVGGPVDALVVAAANSKDDYGEAFLTTFRTFLKPEVLITKLIYRYQSLCQNPTPGHHLHQADASFFLLIRVVNDLNLLDLNQTLLTDLLNFSYELIAGRKIKWAKLLRNCTFDKVAKFKAAAISPQTLVSQPLTVHRERLLNFKPNTLAKQMTLLDMELFQKIELGEMFSYARNQKDDHSPNLTIFVQHFNKMCAWAQTQIITQTKDKNREKYMKQFILIMESLMDYSNFNSYFSLLAALQSPLVSRIPCLKQFEEKLETLGELFNSSRSYAAYRQRLLSAVPPCIPYIGLILQDLTFCHVGNPDLLNDQTSVNFTKRWIQYNIIVNMKRFKNDKYQIERNERVVAFLNNFDDHISEGALRSLRMNKS